jgi:pimeloyl-ACP methyl ester carboxylesterase
MRARQPDVEGHIARDGVRLGYEVYGEAEPTILLLPTWTIIHSRFWKMQIPYLARRYRVVTYDGPGNGRSDRSVDPARYASDSFAIDAVGVLDACDVGSAVVLGCSMGAQYGVRLAALYPERVKALVLIGPALPLAAPAPDRESIPESLHKPYPSNPQGWEKYNVAYWYDHYTDFTEFFFNQVFSEPHSTKPREDASGWAGETGPEVLEADASRPLLGIQGEAIFEGVRCPVLVIHGTEDRLISHQTGVEAARITGGALLAMEGSGHMPNLRDPVKVNLALREFIERVA